MTEWHPVDEGAGEWGGERPTPKDHENHADKEMDLEACLQDQPAIRQQIEQHERDIAATTLEYRDQYNWDGGKRTTIDLPGPFDPTITDQQLAELHRAGLAKEFLLHGSTTRQVSGP